MPVTVRDATADDARAIAEVHVASWRWAYRGQLPADHLEKLSVDDREAMWRSWLRDPDEGAAALVACDEGGRIVGFATAGPSGDLDATREVGELRAIYLLKEVQGTGVGLALHEEALDRLRRAGFVRATLWVLESNELGRRFYERRGWNWPGTVGEFSFGDVSRPTRRYERGIAR